MGRIKQETKPDRILALKQCCDLLLAGGYFRARIAALSPFDKVVGGMVWALTASGQDAGGVDILFVENSTIGEQIKVSEQVSKATRAMKCPEYIQAHQIQGLDYPSIFPVMQWLVRKVIEHRAATGDSVRAVSEQQFDQEYKLPALDVSATAGQLLSSISSRYVAARKFRRRDGAGFQDTAARIEATLMEYGEQLAGTTIVEDEEREEEKKARGGRQKEDAEKQAEEKRMQLIAEEKRRLEEVAKRLAENKADAVVSGSAVGSLVGLQADEIRRANEEYQEGLQATRAEGVDSAERLEQTHQRQAGALKKKVQAAKQLYLEAKPRADKLQEAIDELKAQAAKQDTYIGRIKKETAKLDQLEQESGQGPMLAKLKGLVILNESLKAQEAQFKAACKTQRAELMAMIAALGDDRTDEEAKIDATCASMREKLDKLIKAGAKRNQEIAKLNRAIDDIPARAELLQFERRFVELNGMVADKLVETRKYYAMHNTLQTTYEFMENEVSLLESIIANFPKAMQSKQGKDSFLASITGIVANVETSKKQQADKLASETACWDLKVQKHGKLLAEQRKYFKTVKEFQEECVKNEKLADKLGV